MTVNLFKNGTAMVQGHLAKFEGDFPAMKLRAQKAKEGLTIPHQPIEAKPPPPLSPSLTESLQTPILTVPYWSTQTL